MLGPIRNAVRTLCCCRVAKLPQGSLAMYVFARFHSAGTTYMMLLWSLVFILVHGVERQRSTKTTRSRTGTALPPQHVYRDYS